MAHVFQPWCLLSLWLNCVWEALPPGRWVPFLPPHPHSTAASLTPSDAIHMASTKRSHTLRRRGLGNDLVPSLHVPMQKLRPKGEVIGPSPQQRSLDQAWSVPLPLGQWPVLSQVGSTSVSFDNELIQDLTEGILSSSRWINIFLKAGTVWYLLN